MYVLLGEGLVEEVGDDGEVAALIVGRDDHGVLVGVGGGGAADLGGRTFGA